MVKCLIAIHLLGFSSVTKEADQINNKLDLMNPTKMYQLDIGQLTN